MAFDLSSLDTVAVAETGAKMVVLHPATGVPLETEDGKPVFLVLAGEDSEKCRSARRAVANKRLRAQTAGLRAQITRDEIENDNLEVLVACTLDWGGVALGSAGADMTFNHDNARTLYKRLPWLREQAEAFVADRSNFLKPSPKG